MSNYISEDDVLSTIAVLEDSDDLFEAVNANSLGKKSAQIVTKILNEIEGKLLSKYDEKLWNEMDEDDRALVKSTFFKIFYGKSPRQYFKKLLNLNAE